MCGNGVKMAAAICAGLVWALGADAVLAQTGGGSPGEIPPAPVYPPVSADQQAQGELKESLPLVVIDDTTYDAGTIWQGEDIRHTFTIRNEGQDNLVVRLIRKSCGCTGLEIPNKVIPPQTSSSISMRVNTKGKRGRFSVNATLGTNDPLMPELRLTAKGDAKPYVDIKPRPSAIFGRVQQDTASSKEFTLTGNLEERLDILSVTIDHPRFTHTLIPIEEGKSYKLTISTQPPLKRGANNGMCTVRTSYEGVPDLRIRCSAYVPERLSLRPTRLQLSSPTTFADAQRVIYLQDEGDQQAEILSVRTTHEDISVDSAPHPSGRGYRVTVNVKPGLVIPPEGHSVFIETSDEEYRVLEAKITARRQPAGSRRPARGRPKLSPPTTSPAKPGDKQP